MGQLWVGRLHLVQKAEIIADAPVFDPLPMLEEASAAEIIEEQSIVDTSRPYRFGHAFFRQTLYDEIVVPRRIRLHQQVAHALEVVHGARIEEHAAELAEHYAFSSDPLESW